MNAFLVLAYERGRQAPQQINSAIGMSDLYQRLKQVKNKLVGPSRRNLPKLYMVKVDIKKAFDSINQDNLLKIIDGILKEDIYMIHRHSKVMPSNGMITKRFLPKAIAPNEMPSFLGFARSQAEISKHAVLIDKCDFSFDKLALTSMNKVVHSFESKAAILDLVQEHISENIVKFGSDYYRQTTGVPQGSILSPALCRSVHPTTATFFYDEMEKDVLSDFSQTEDSALLRLVDDFLFISQSQSKAAAFLKKMWQGHPDYGCFINEKKTLTNFDITVNGASIQRCQGNDFPYCGLLINSKTLEIRVDYSRYHGENVRNLLTVVRDLHPGRSIVLKMKKAMQYTCQMAFSDTSFNSISQVMLNIYQNFNFCCMKFHAYLLELCLDPVISSGSIQFLQQQQQRQRRIQFIQPAALYSIVLDIFRVCFGLLHNSRRSTVGVAAGAVFKIGERHVRWLGAMAFLRTLPNLPIYDPLKIMLQEQILNTNQDQNHYFKRILHSVVKDSRNRIMDTIQYQ
ncbi:hypothetical protein BX616_002755 [Lobosporangium transversale]|nr:hypothetical protein BX616_002755 [Lobosporangium transversale]